MKTDVLRRICAAAAALVLCGQAVPPVRAGTPDRGRTVAAAAYSEEPAVMCVMLEGAGNKPDISIPLSGFSGDYCDIFIADHICGCVTSGPDSMIGGSSMFLRMMIH